MARTADSRWWILLLCVILGGFIGVYLQRFPLTERFFRDIIDIGFDLKSLDLIVVDFGLRLYVRMNLGTFLGGVTGVLMIR
ncbi:MAG: hypothetical protein WCS47_05725 [Thermovirgaceae bacterium]|jgi:hypothetical protein|nr:hypothetical protein [Synergistales bacterium]MDI9393474.1 hypothetical protein [Synergistota bacterium]NLV65592.1 hypothetical protein [Synergistaceae bacterium]HRW87331.1 hypothetical protein [Thermovirgaceae bacterium]MDD3133612.1 hypothetical protein [Synergistales bacterium]